ncbi:MAG: sensor histidine kinase [Gracilimonas sp.]|nr:sensor histidine kinase [Gracilimonas sp.]
MTKLWEKYKLRVRHNIIEDSSKIDGIEYWRNKLFATILIYLFPFGLVTLIPSAFVVYFLGIKGLAISYALFGVAISVITLYSRININIRKFLFLTLLYSVSFILIFYMGHHGAGLTYLFGVTVFSLLILPTYAGVLTIFINILICLLHAYFIYSGMVDYPLRENYQVASWLSISANSILLSTVAVIFMPMLFRGLQETIESQYRLKKNLVTHKDQLENSLSEKETLLAEIHHRVKNNLAVVSGMLQIQAFKESDEEFQKKLMDSTMRIKSMANIHEQLYQSQSFSNMDFDIGLKNLVQTIIDTMSDGKSVQTSFDLQPVKLNINQAVPCSLIMNEVITNSLKHAFHERKDGLISVLLEKNGATLRMKITDNGSGFEEDIDSLESNSLGLELIRTLVRQLDAKYQYRSRENGSGAYFDIEFSMSDSSGSSGS